MVCKNCEEDLENSNGYKIFRDIAMVFVGAVLVQAGVIIALSVFILVYAALRVLKKYVDGGK